MYIIAKHALAWQELIKLGNGNWGRCLLGKDRTFKDGILLQVGVLHHTEGKVLLLKRLLSLVLGEAHHINRIER